MAFVALLEPQIAARLFTILEAPRRVREDRLGEPARGKTAMGRPQESLAES
jgi:hypothetical protein